MANIKLIKRRIKSAQNIAQITRAMEMVAASKMKKAQEVALLGKPYADKIYQVTRELAARTSKQYHPLLSEGNKNGKILIILISTNKGLCGALNTNLFRFVSNSFSVSGALDFINVGKKGQNFIVKTGKKLIADFSDKVPFDENVPALTQLIVDGFIQGTYKEVHLCFNSFINALKQMPTKKMILPISVLTSNEEVSTIPKYEFIIEPSVDDVLEYLLPHYLENQIRSAIYEAEASEHSARMIAMRNATDAAADLLDELTLVFNKIRQEKITYEIADMVTARLAVE